MRTCGRVLVVVGTVPVRYDVVAELNTKRELVLQDVDLIEEEYQTRPREQWVGDDRLPQKNGVLLR